MLTIKQFDSKYTSQIRSVPDKWGQSLRRVSLAGEPLVISSLGALGFLISYARNKTQAWHAFLYAGIAYGINISLKLLLRRKRPHGRVIRTLGIQSYSFPSGHAFGTVLLYGLLAYLASKHLVSGVAGLTAVLLIALIGIIGVSRVYLGSHYPSDVLAGWMLGAFSLVIVISISFH